MAPSRPVHVTIINQGRQERTELQDRGGAEHRPRGRRTGRKVRDFLCPYASRTSFTATPFLFMELEGIGLEGLYAEIFTTIFPFTLPLSRATHASRISLKSYTAPMSGFSSFSSMKRKMACIVSRVGELL